MPSSPKMSQKPRKYDRFYDRLPIAGEEAFLYRCKWCGWTRPMQPSASTSSIRWHLEKAHGNKEEIREFINDEKRYADTLARNKKEKLQKKLLKKAKKIKYEPDTSAQTLQFVNNQGIEDYFAANLLPSNSHDLQINNLDDFASFNDSISPTSNEHINEHNKHEENDQNEEDERIEDAIMEMIATDALPLSTVEMPGFRHLMSVVMPGFEIRSREHFERVVMPRVFRKKNQN